ncbi:9332_t:CDS:2 [Entrophospora sp. SA101]|nr:9332_t:CDS:2 [Entrophospora sp. SA101]
MTGFLNGIIQLPIINITDSGVDFVCPGTGPTSSLREYTSFFSQVGTFIPIAGLLFTIAVYGAKSIFGIMTTCLIDDIVIITTSFGPIFWWYTFTKPLWFYGVTNQIQDTNQNYGLIYSIILCILFGTMIIVQTIAAIIRFHFHQRRNKLDEVSLWFRMAPKQFDEFNSDNGSKVVVYARQINLLFLNYFMNFCYFLATLCLVVTYHFPDLEKYITSKSRRYSGFVRKKVFFFTIILCILHAFFEYYWFCTDPFFNANFNTILVIVLTRSIASFFSNSGVIECTYKHGEDEKVFAEIKVRNINEVVHFYKMDETQDKWIRCRFGSAGGYFYICEEKEDEGKSDEKVFAEIKVRNINEVVHFYKMDETQDKWIRCRFGSAGGYFYICEEKEDEGKSEKNEEKIISEKEKSEKEKEKNYKYFYVTIDDKWVHFYELEYKYDKEEHIKDLLKGVFESEPILKEIMEITETEENCILKHRNCERIKEVMKKNLKDEKRKTLEAEGENVTNTNIIDVEKATETKMKTIKVKKMKAEDKVLINILETGALNYFIYSHRKDYKGNKENDKPKVPKVKYVFDINKVHKKC